MCAKVFMFYLFMIYLVMIYGTSKKKKKWGKDPLLYLYPPAATAAWSFDPYVVAGFDKFV